MLRPLVSKSKQQENESWQKHQERLKMILERCAMFTDRDVGNKQHLKKGSSWRSRIAFEEGELKKEREREEKGRSRGGWRHRQRLWVLGSCFHIPSFSGNVTFPLLPHSIFSDSSAQHPLLSPSLFPKIIIREDLI